MMDDCITISDDEDVQLLEQIVNLEPIVRVVDLTENEDEATQETSRTSDDENRRPSPESSPEASNQQPQFRAFQPDIVKTHQAPPEPKQPPPSSEPKQQHRPEPRQQHQSVPHWPPTPIPKQRPPPEPRQWHRTDSKQQPQSVPQWQPPHKPDQPPSEPKQQPQSVPQWQPPHKPDQPPSEPKQQPQSVPQWPPPPPPKPNQPPSEPKQQPQSIPQCPPSSELKQQHRPEQKQQPPLEPKQLPILDKDYLESQKELGNQKYRNNQFDDAIRIYRNAISLAKKLNDKEMSAILHFNLAMTYYKVSSFDQAADECAHAVKYNPDYLKAHLKRAEIYTRQYKFDEAVICYEHICKIDGNNSDHTRLLQKAKELATRMVKKKDYYQILGLNHNFTKEDLKRAYRQKALSHHPDRHSDADIITRRIEEKRFKEASEAHSFLQNRVCYQR